MQANAPQVIWTWIDASGSESTCRLSLPLNISVSAAAAEADAMRPILSVLSDAVIIRQDLTYTWYENPAPAAAGAQLVTHAAVFVFSTSEPAELAVMLLPAVAPGILTTAGDMAGLDVDRTLADVISVIDQLTGGLWCNPWGFDLVECIAAIYTEKP